MDDIIDRSSSGVRPGRAAASGVGAASGGGAVTFGHRTGSSGEGKENTVCVGWPDDPDTVGQGWRRCQTGCVCGVSAVCLWPSAVVISRVALPETGVVPTFSVTST